MPQFTSVVAGMVIIVTAGRIIVDLQDLVGHIQEQTLSVIYLDFRPCVLVVKLARQVQKDVERHFRDEVNKKYIVLAASQSYLETTAISHETNLMSIEIFKLIFRVILQFCASLEMYFVTLKKVCQTVAHREKDFFFI